MEFKELTLEELIQGYVRLDEEQAYQCIFCGERFEEGLIYTSRGRSVSAHRAMQEAGASVPMFGLAKRFEEIYLPGKPDPIVLDRRSNALHLVQYVRDEAHRFGITHHRDLRQKAGMHSTLEDIPGVGATRRRALLTHFKSVANIAAATPEALCEVEGIGKAQAKAIWAYYHPEEKESGGAKP